ncbi:MAG: PepSY domain-containing protein [Bacteroidetes bacterium]|nr:PepSY domain-containing protein [Bacteroidota bacterium]MBS1629989.1 PepSY domain-containing protein [Bacteroidota bacterium]
MQKLGKKLQQPAWKRINAWLHLWLGLTSGLVVFVVSITGCIYAFEKEIRDWTQPYQYVEPQAGPFLPPTRLSSLARAYAFGNLPDTGEYRIRSVQYGEPGMAAIAAYQTKKQGYTMVYLNPYNGAVLHEKILKQDFFRIILAGHFYLWLPPKIGQPVVASATLIFVVLLVSGLVMWWPKNLKRANSDKSFKIKWKARFKRLNYDLHNVLGFYVLLFGLVLGLTGLVWGFEWFNKSVYWAASGGHSLPAKEKSVSDTAGFRQGIGTVQADRLWLLLRPESRNEQGRIQIQFPMKKMDVFTVISNPDLVTYYRREQRRYDRYSLAQMPLNGVFAKPFVEASGADKLNRMNYDIHVGAVLGLPGKILAFFASLICGSLPVTGFFIWFWKKKKQRRKERMLMQQPVVMKPQRRRVMIPEPEFV